VSVLERPDGARLWWTSEGQGEPVVLVMGLAYPADMWFRVSPVLAERYRVIRLDNRGAGRTGDVPGMPYTVETMAADVLAVLDEAGESTAHVVGVSMGGLVAQEVAMSAPERVRSLVLACTHPGAAHAVWDPEAPGPAEQPGRGHSAAGGGAVDPVQLRPRDATSADRAGLVGAPAAGLHTGRLPAPSCRGRRSGPVWSGCRPSRRPRWSCTATWTGWSRRPTDAGSPSWSRAPRWR